MTAPPERDRSIRPSNLTARVGDTENRALQGGGICKSVGQAAIALSWKLARITATWIVAWWLIGQGRAATPGMATWDLKIGDLLREEGSDLLYATVQAGSPQYANHLIAIDLATREISDLGYVGENPGEMASDGLGTLYIGLNGTMEIQPLDLVTGALGESFPVGPAERIEDVAVQPGHPGVVAVATRLRYDTSKTVIFDEGIPRPKSLDIRNFAFSPDGSRLYGRSYGFSYQEGVREASVDAEGLHMEEFHGTSQPLWLSGDIQVVERYTEFPAAVNVVGPGGEWLAVYESLEYANISRLAAFDNESWLEFRINADQEGLWTLTVSWPDYPQYIPDWGMIDWMTLDLGANSPFNLVPVGGYAVAFNSEDKLYLIDMAAIEPPDLAVTMKPVPPPILGTRIRLDFEVKNSLQVEARDVVLYYYSYAGFDNPIGTVSQGVFSLGNYDPPGKGALAKLGSLPPGGSAFVSMSVRVTSPLVDFRVSVSGVKPDANPEDNRVADEFLSVLPSQYDRVIAGVNVRGAAFDRANERLLAAILDPGDGGRYWLLTANPNGGRFGLLGQLPSSPGPIAVAGNVLYVTYPTLGRVVGYDVNTTAFLSRSELGSGRTVRNLVVSESDPHRLIVETDAGAMIFRSGVQLPASTPSIGPWADAGGGEFFQIARENGQCRLRRLTLSDQSVVETASLVVGCGWPGLAAFAGLQSAAGRLFLDNGEEHYPHSLELLAVVPGTQETPSRLWFDDRAHRLFVMGRNAAGFKFSVRDTSLQEERAIDVPITQGVGQPFRMIGFGPGRAFFFSQFNSGHVCAFIDSGAREPADLEISQDVLRTTDAAGVHFSHEITVRNRGPGHAEGVVVRDRLYNGLRLDGTEPTASLNTTEGMVTFALGTLAANETASVRVNLTAILRGGERNQVEVSSRSPDPDLSDNSAVHLEPLRPHPGRLVNAFALNTDALTWDKVTGRFYFGAPSLETFWPHGLFHADPVGGAVEYVLGFPIPISDFAMHPQGGRMYVLTTNDFIRRHNTVKGSTAYRTNLRWADLGAVRDIELSSHADDQLIVAYEQGLAAYHYDQRGPSLSIPNAAVAFNGDGSVVWAAEFGSRQLRRIPFAPQTGFGTPELVSEVFGRAGSTELQGAGGWLFDNIGLALPEAAPGGVPQEFGVLPAQGLMVASAETKLVYSLYEQGGVWRLRVFHLNGLQLAYAFDFPSLPAPPDDLVLWGKEGIAFRAGTRGVYTVRTSLLEPVGRSSLTVKITPAKGLETVIGPFDYAVTISNGGATTAEQVVLTHTVPPGLQVVSAAASGGVLSMEAGQRVLRLPTLNPGQQAVLTMRVTAAQVGTYPTRAEVRALGIDLTPADNEAAGTVAFDLGPKISVRDSQAYESAGSVVATVQLNRVSTLPTKVTLSFRDDSAVLGQDYQAGSLTFEIAPGKGKKLIAVPLVADGLAEGTERFFAELSNPLNGVIDDGTGVLTILNGAPLRAFGFPGAAHGVGEVRIVGLEVAEGMAELRFTVSEAGRFQVEYVDNLTDGRWVPVGNVAESAGGEAVLAVELPEGMAQGFWRVARVE